MRRVSTTRILFAGLAGTGVLTLMLGLGPAIGGPPINLPLWDGTVFTLNLTWAVAVGYLVHFTIGVVLAFVYVELIMPRLMGEAWLKGALFGALVWALLMIVGLPLFDVLDPLVSDGLMAAPGLFALGLGVSAPIMLLVAHLLYGAVVGSMVGTPEFQVVRRPSW